MFQVNETIITYQSKRISAQLGMHQGVNRTVHHLPNTSRVHPKPPVMCIASRSGGVAVLPTRKPEPNDTPSIVVVPFPSLGPTCITGEARLMRFSLGSTDSVRATSISVLTTEASGTETADPYANDATPLKQEAGTDSSGEFSAHAQGEEHPGLVHGAHSDHDFMLANGASNTSSALISWGDHSAGVLPLISSAHSTPPSSAGVKLSRTVAAC